MMRLSLEIVIRNRGMMGEQYLVLSGTLGRYIVEMYRESAKIHSVQSKSMEEVKRQKSIGTRR